VRIAASARQPSTRMCLWIASNRHWQVLELRLIEEDEKVNFFFLSTYSHTTTISTTTMAIIPLLSPPLLCVIVDLLYPFFPHSGREKGYFRDFFLFSRGLAGWPVWLGG